MQKYTSAESAGACIRHACTGDDLAIKNIWKTVFDDSDEDIDLFFKHFSSRVKTLVADNGSGPVAMGHLVPIGNYLPYGNISEGTVRVSCAMIYAVATLPEFRGQGNGASVVRELIDMGHKSGYKALVLCPSEDSLFGFYGKRTKLRDWFYINEKVHKKPFASSRINNIHHIEETKYNKLREKLLSAVPHIEYDTHILSYQILLSSQFGGGLFTVDTPSGPAAAVVERQSNGAVWINELLAPAEYENDVVSLIADRFPALEYVVRSPALSVIAGSGARRYGMLALADHILPDAVTNGVLPWYGLAFF